MADFHFDILIGLASKISVILLLSESISLKKETNTKKKKKKTYDTLKIIRISLSNFFFS
jgi:hypothetical protein